MIVHDYTLQARVISPCRVGIRPTEMPFVYILARFCRGCYKYKPVGPSYSAKGGVAVLIQMYR